jgi:prepilin-type N-terminal cleavage/methylation domain-containing protein
MGTGWIFAQVVRMRKRVNGQAGYSLIELMIVLGVLGILTGMTVITIGNSKQGLNGDGAMRVVVSQMNQAKQLAITQRRNMYVSFPNNNSVQIVREEVPGPTMTTISAVPFEGGLQFLRINSLGEPPAPELPAPAPSAILPALVVSTAIAFGAPTTQARFTPEGVLVDQDGITLNGTLFVTLPNQIMSARAITIFGSTGRVRAFRWDGSSWKVV